MSGTFSPIPNFTGPSAGQQFRQAVNDALGGTETIAPTLGSATTATGVNISQAVAAAAVTDGALRTLTARATDRINFADYAGADPTGNNDNSALIAQALADARGQKKALYFPAGTWGYAASATIQAGDRIAGDGWVSQFKYIGPTTSAGQQTVFTTGTLGAIAAPSTYTAPTILRNFRVSGPWNGTSVTYGVMQNVPLIQAQGLNTLIMDGLFIEYSVSLGIQASFNYNVLLTNCDFRYTARGPFAASGSSIARILGNTFLHCDDDAITLHVNYVESWGRSRVAIVQGNTIIDCAGITLQAASETIIEGNVLRFCKQVGIEVSFVNANPAEGEAAPVAVRIAGNVITDMINRTNIDGLDTEGHYIVVGTVPARQGATSGASQTATGVPTTNLTALGGSTVISQRYPSAQAWAASTGFQVGAVLVDSNGNVQQSVDPAAWAASTAYAAGVLVIDGNGNLQQCATAGTSGTSAPAWSGTKGGTTADGTVGLVWTLAFVMPVNQGATPATPYLPASGASAPAWATLFSQSTFDGTVRWQNKGANAVAGVVEPYRYLDNMIQSGSDTATAIAPGFGIEVCGNICMRKLSVTSPVLYSTLFGERMFTRYGFQNPTLGANELLTGMSGVHVFSGAGTATLLRQLRITGNQIAGLAIGVLIDAAVQIVGGEISRNEIVDFPDYGVKFTTPGQAHRLEIAENLFDGDPYMLSRGTGTGGTWESGSTTVVALKANGTSGVVARGNRFRNVMAVDDGAAGAWQYERNWIYCNPAAVGFSASNVGVATVPAAGAGFVHVIEDGNPGNSTLGNVLNMPVLYASAQPGSGTYVQGLFVVNSAPNYSSGTTVLGWLRLTTGSGNVANTDWIEVVGHNS